MRDIFEEIFENQPLDPEESARRNMRPKLRARFYQAAAVGEGPDGFPVLLDGRPVRTPARRLLAAPARGAGGGASPRNGTRSSDKVDPAAMPLTRLANSIIDGVAPAPAPVRGRDREVSRHRPAVLSRRRAGRAGRAASAQHWDPVVEWARETLGARFVLAEGVIHAPQPAGGDRGGGGGDPARRRHQRVLAARRAQRRHHADRLGAAGAGARGRPRSPPTRPGLPRMSTRTGTWQFWGRDELSAGSAAPIASPRCRRRQRCWTRCASSFARVPRTSDRAPPRARSSPSPRRRVHRLKHQAPAGMRRREFGVALDRLVEACQRFVEPAQRLQRQPAVGSAPRRVPG